MNEFYERIKNLSPSRLALLAVELQTRLDAAQRAQQPDPIAIIGMSCRVPGAQSPEAYWELLRDGVDAIRETPTDRWNIDAYFDANVEAAGKMNSRWGGYVDAITAFEPELFGISPREANSMDPQHRMLLECSWEALERAGIAPNSLHGSPVGVFVGICNNDYGQMLMADDPAKTDAWYATGNAHSIASGRISYVFGLQGPSVAIDTACSSSLVAIHQAVHSLRAGECTMALAGGVNALLSPITTVILSRARMLAPDGRCKTFDASADGFVRSEGCGIIVLKKLSAAVANGDTVLAIIRGSAINQDGRSNGLTAPNGPSQVAVIQAALADARLAAEQVQYVECHGTGTSLGDPIEVQALQKAIGSSHTHANPLVIGSAKTNLGHLESAAGVAGLIKVILMMQAEEIPPHLHLQSPNPHIAWDEMALKIAQQRTPWASVNGKRIAGVSSFGFSGTNAHILLESADAPDASSAPIANPAHEAEAFPVLLSARTRKSLAAQAEQLAAWLEAHPQTALADIASTLAASRATLPNRLATVAESTNDLIAHLRRWQTGDEDALLQGEASTTQTPRIAFLFSGAGAQYVGMGDALYHAEPIFRAAIDRCHDLLQGRLAMGLRELLFGAAGTPAGEALDRIENAQPALFALQFALVELWRAWGIAPDAVAGHSAGEYAAAVCAGVLTLEEGLDLVLARSQLMATLPAQGEMLSVHTTLPQVETGLQRIGRSATIAVINASDRIVLSGTAAEIEAAHQHFAAHGIETKRLQIGVAAHSPQVDPILDAFERVARGISYRAPEVTLVSSVGTRASSAGAHDNGTSENSTDTRTLQGSPYQSAAYWRNHLRNPVRFADAVEVLYHQGYRIFVEIGPHTTLAEFCRRTVASIPQAVASIPQAGGTSQPSDVAAIPSLRRNQNAHGIFQRAAAELLVRGAHVNLLHRFTGVKAQRLPLPTYAFDRAGYWITTSVQRGAPFRQAHTNARSLAGEPLFSPRLDGVVYETNITPDQPAFLRDHHVFGAVLLPSPLLLAMASEAARDAWGAGWAITGFSIREGARIPAEGLRVQTILADQHGERSFQIVSRDAQTGKWTLHAIGALAPESGAPLPQVTLDAIRARCDQQLDAADYYRQLWEIGLEFGPQFRGLATLHFRDGEALGRVSLAAEDALPPLSTFHPAALDASLHLIGAAFRDPTQTMQPFLLTTIDRVDQLRPLPNDFWSHITVTARNADSVTCDVTLCDDHGAPYLQLHGLFLRRASAAAMRRAANALPRNWLYNVRWNEAPWLLDPLTEAVTAEQAQSLASPARRAEFGLPAYLEFVSALDEIALDFAALALATVQKSQVVASQQRLYDRLALVTADRPRPASAQSLETQCDALFSLHPEGSAEIALTRRCALLLPQILRGEVSGVATLFPNGSNHLTEPLYRATPLARFHNTAIAESVVNEVRRRLADGSRSNSAPIRIVEVGGGSASTTRAVLDALAHAGLLAAIAYHFTDISPHFTLAASNEFGSRTTFAATPFNIEATPESQGITTHAADILIAANVLHATANLRDALSHVASLLAEGALSLILEGVTPHAWVDITFGTLPGWWHFSDHDLRPNYPLLSADAWRALLAAAALPCIGVVAADPALGESVLLVARSSSAPTQPVGASSPKRLWLVASGNSAASAALRAALLADLHAQGDVAKAIADLSHLPEAIAPVDSATQLELIYLVGGNPPNAETTVFSPASVQQRILLDMQTLLRQSTHTPMRLWIVTQGAQAVDADDAPNWVQAAAWGMGRVLGLEYADKWGGLIDLPAHAEAPSILRAIVLADTQEDQFAIRNHRGYLPRLQRDERPLLAEIVPTPASAWLITGGLGGLGLRVAQRLAEAGASEIVLVGRTPLPTRTEWQSATLSERQRTQIAAIQAIEAQGAQVHTVACDIADAAALKPLIDRFGADLLPLEGVLHCAADLSDAPFLALTPAQIGGQLRAKVDGAWNLHQLTQAKALRHFVLFSSTTALLGVANLGHYAAANAALDALAFQRRAEGLPALSINWGTWDVMRVASASEQANVSAHGLRQMDSSTALSLMMSVLNTDTPQIVIADVEWNRLKPLYEARRPRPFLAEVADMPTETDRMTVPVETNRAPIVPEKKQPELRRRLANASTKQDPDLVIDWVRELVANTLGVKSTDAIHDETGLFEMGMDSLMSIDLKGRLEKGSGLSLPTTLTFNYPSVRALAGYIGGMVQAEERSGGATSPATTASTPASTPVSAAASAAATAESKLDVNALDEDDLSALLAQKLSRLRS